MNRNTIPAAGLRLLLAAMLSLPALAQANEALDARAECSAQKHRVHTLEDRGASAGQISSARKEWENACLRAHQLMSGINPSPIPASSPIRPTTFRMADKLSPESEQQVRKGWHFKVTILDHNEEMARMEPPKTIPAGALPIPAGKPKPLF